jgi:hypothetical protein
MPRSRGYDSACATGYENSQVARMGVGCTRTGGGDTIFGSGGVGQRGLVC